MATPLILRQIRFQSLRAFKHKSMHDRSNQMGRSETDRPSMRSVMAAGGCAAARHHVQYYAAECAAGDCVRGPGTGRRFCLQTTTTVPQLLNGVGQLLSNNNGGRQRRTMG